MAAFKNCLQKPVLKSFLQLQQVRYYPRWSHRRPVRIYTPEEYATVQKENVQKFEEVTHKFKPQLESKCEVTEHVEKITKNKNVEQTDSDDNTEVPDFGFKKITQQKNANLRRPIHKKEVPKVDMLETIIDVDGNLVYTKMQNKDTRITYV